MANIIPVGTKRDDVYIGLEMISRIETRILVGIAPESENNQEAIVAAKRISGNEMLVLRHQGFEMPADFKPKKIRRKIDGKRFKVTIYVFIMAEWKRKTMKGWFE